MTSTSSCCCCCCCLCTAAIIFGLVQVNCILARSWTRAVPGWGAMSRLQWDESNVAHVSPMPTLPLQLPVGGGGWWVLGWTVLRSKIACPKAGQVKCCVKISSGQTPRQVHKSGLSSGLGKGYPANGGWGIRFAVLGFGIALRAQHNRFRMRNAGDIIGKHKHCMSWMRLLFFPFSHFPIFPFLLCCLTA